MVLPVLAAATRSDESAAQLLVVNSQDGMISVIEPKSGATKGIVRVGAGPHVIAVSPDGRTAVVPNYGGPYAGQSLSVIDIPSMRHVRTIRLRLEERALDGTLTKTTTFNRPYGAAFIPGQPRVVVTCEAKGTLLVVDLLESRVVTAIDTGQELSHLVLVSPDGRRAFVSNKRSGSVAVINLGRNKVEKVIKTGGGAAGMVFHPTRPELWVANSQNDSISVIDTKKLEEKLEFPCGASPVALAFTRDGERMLCVNQRSGTISVFHTERRKTMKAINLGARRSRFNVKPSGLLMAPDGASAYVTCTGTNTVCVIDTVSWKVKRRIHVGVEPDGLAWSLQGEPRLQAK